MAKQQEVLIKITVPALRKYSIGWFSAYDALKGMVVLYGADKVQEALADITSEIRPRATDAARFCPECYAPPLIQVCQEAYMANNKRPEKWWSTTPKIENGKFLCVAIAPNGEETTELFSLAELAIFLQDINYQKTVNQIRAMKGYSPLGFKIICDCARTDGEHDLFCAVEIEKREEIRSRRKKTDTLK